MRRIEAHSTQIRSGWEGNRLWVRGAGFTLDASRIALPCKSVGAASEAIDPESGSGSSLTSPCFWLTGDEGWWQRRSRVSQDLTGLTERGGEARIH